MNGANFHQFKGLDWQTVAVRPTTIKADLYSLALSPIAISDVTVWSSSQRNFAELHLVLKGLNVEWKMKVEEDTHTHLSTSGTEAPSNASSGLTAVIFQQKDMTAHKQTVQVSHRFIISISRLIEMFQNQKITMPSFLGTLEVMALSHRSLQTIARVMWETVSSGTQWNLWQALNCFPDFRGNKFNSVCQTFPLWLSLTSQSMFG